MHGGGTCSHVHHVCHALTVLLNQLFHNGGHDDIQVDANGGSSWCLSFCLWRGWILRVAECGKNEKMSGKINGLGVLFVGPA